MAPKEISEITQSETARRLNCSQTQIMNFVREGRLKPRRESAEGHCRVWYQVEAVERLKKEWEPTRNRYPKRADPSLAQLAIRGRIAAQALPLFEAGATLTQVCVATEADPRIIQELYEAWQLGLEGAVAAKRKQRAEQQAREVEKALRAERRQERWIEMRLQVAKQEAGKRPLALPRLEHPPLKIDEPDGKKRTA